MTLPCDHTAELQALTARVAALEAERALEAFVDLPTAATLLHTTRLGLHGHLRQHAALLSPPRYRFNTGSRRYRMLPASDVRILQALTIRRTRRIAAALAA